MSAALEIRGAATGLLDDPLLLRVRGGAGDQGVLWRARYRDDHARVWRATATRSQDLAEAWAPAKAGGTGTTLAALQSLRGVSIDVRVEIPDGRAANRTLTRRLLGEGVRVRRWRDGLAASLYLPVVEQPCATVVVAATAGSQQLVVATLAAALLSSRGVLALVVALPKPPKSLADVLTLAVERLALMPRASKSIEVLSVRDPFAGVAASEPRGELVLPPGVGARGLADNAVARALAWDGLLARLGAVPRDRGEGPERLVGDPGTVGR
jgi:hypothetical protein